MTEKICSRCCSSLPRPPQTLKVLPFPRPLSICFSSILKTLAIIGGILASSHFLSSQEIEYRTLPQLIETGTQSLAHRDYRSAATAFNAILDNYRNEAVWTETDLPEKILPLAGFTSHKAELHPAAIAAFTEFLDTQNSNTDNQLFARYTLAVSLLEEGEAERAHDNFSLLRETAGSTPFRDLSLIRQAQLSEAEVARTFLQELLENPTSQRLADYAQLELARLSMESGDYDTATFHILDTRFATQGYSELAIRSHLASQLAEKIEEEAPDLALRCYQSIAPKSDLIQSLESSIGELRNAFNDLAPKLRTEQSMWIDYYRNAIAELEAQLEGLRNSEDYADSISIRKARCFARINRPLEAWIILESLVSSDSSVSRLAHLDWISVARSMNAWQASAVIAKEFINLYPDDVHIPQTLFLIALAQIEQDQFLAAIDSLNSIASIEPNPELLASCHYYIGYSNFRLSRFEASIQSYRKASATNPDSLLAAQANIWIGLSHFSLFQIDPAIEAFDTVLENEAWRILHPEATYRKAATLFAAGELGRSEQTLSGWVQNFSPHEREAEVYLLIGDIHYESGETSEAIKAYRKVESSDIVLLHNATEKLASIHLSSGSSNEALSTLLNFEKSQTISDEIAAKHFLLKARVLSESSQADEAKRELENAIESFGAKIEAEGMLEVILTRYDNADAALEILANKTAQELPPTLLARYRVARARLAERIGNLSQARRSRLSLVSDFSIDQLPPEGLLDAGNALLLIKSQETPKYFKKLLESFPDSKYSDESHLGLAKYQSSLDRHEAALTHLDSIAFPSPDAYLLQLETETALKLTTAAQSTAETILSERYFPPNAKAKALLVLGNRFLKEQESEKAYNYFQRVFTLYRGEREAVADAYLQCGKILYQQSLYNDSRSVLEELVSQEDLVNLPQTAEAQELLEQLPSPSEEVPL